MSEVVLPLILKENYLLCIHEKVDDGVDSRVCHGQPEEGEEHVLGVGLGEHCLEYRGHIRTEHFWTRQIQW